MESRSATSSPDPLGPPGDAEYLISSPLKPLSDYRHVTSSPKPTPSIQTRKKTNNKGSQPVRLQDIVMSATPTPGRISENRLSPTKSTMLSENNLSPWRIRVTVEAEHEDGVDNGENAYMKSLPGSRTTKVPLKKEIASPSPKKKRGRPRKSDAPQGNLTSSKTIRNTPKAKGNSGGKRKRATPSKKIPPNSDIAESIEGRDGPDSASAKPRGDDSLFDIDVNQNIDADIVLNSSPDDFDEGNLRGYMSSNNSSPRASKKRLSNIPSLPPRQLENELDENIRLTPSKQPSRDRKRAEVSPENTMHAGHTPGPKPRFYPTPTTSSSLLEDEQAVKTTNASIGEEVHAEERDEMVSVAFDHREYDTIMEGEEFSMVSLDTLPSAKQRADSTRQNISQTTNLEVKKANPPVPLLPHVKESRKATSSRPSPGPLPFQNINKNPSLPNHTPAIINKSLPTQPPPPAQSTQPSALTTKKTIPSLARVVRSGIALQGVLDRRGKNSRLRSPFSSPSQSSSKSPADRKKRLDDLFSGFDPETQRELRAGLRFGEELARRQRESQAERRREDRRRSSATRHDAEDEINQEPIYPKLPMSDFDAEYGSPPQEEDDFHPDEHLQPTTPIDRNSGLPEDGGSPSSMSSREAEWQREREAISREIQMANSSQVIVIDNDDEGDGEDNVEQDIPANVDGAPEDDWENSIKDHDYEVDEVDEVDEEDYEDIWQLEARDPDPLGESTSFVNEDEQEIQKRRRTEIPSPWKRGEGVDYSSQDVETGPSLFWGSRSQRGQPVLANVETQMKKLREQEIDISALLKEQAAQSRSFYEDEDMPGSVQERSPNAPAKRHKQPRTDRSSQPGSSPFTYSKAQIQSRLKLSLEKSPASARQRAHSISSESEQSPPPLNEDPYPDDEEHSPYDYSSESALQQQGPPSEQSPDHPAPDTRTPSSWFRSRLTSLAPNWLKSPAVEKSRSLSSPPSDDLPEAQDFRQSLDHPNLPQQPQQISPIHRSPLARITEHNSRNRRRTPPPKALATSGYFTNDHYNLLRRLYRQAKVFPELFPYNPTPKRSVMLGHWMWSADGLHSHPITELQIAIVDRFMQELIRNDARNRSENEHQLGWAEEELVRRLFSIIVGEKVRKERKLREARMNRGRSHRAPQRPA